MMRQPSLEVLRSTRNVALLVSVGLIVGLTLGPRGGETIVEVTQLDEVVDALRRSDKHFLLEFLLEAVANILLFVPFGAALGLRGFSVRKAALYGYVLSGLVEGAQLLVISGRTTSLDDVLLNTFGAVVGQSLIWRWMPEGLLARGDSLP